MSQGPVSIVVEGVDASRSPGLTIEQRERHDAARSAFEQAWYAKTVTDPDRAQVLIEMLAMIEGGEKARLSTAAQEVGIPGATARSWKLRSRAFQEAVDAISALPPVPPPEAKPEPEPLGTWDFQLERVRLVEEIEHWTLCLRRESVRERNGHHADPAQCERELHRRQDRLANLDEYLERR